MILYKAIIFFPPFLEEKFGYSFRIQEDDAAGKKKSIGLLKAKYFKILMVSGKYNFYHLVTENMTLEKRYIGTNILQKYFKNHTMESRQTSKGGASSN